MEPNPETGGGFAVPITQNDTPPTNDAPLEATRIEKIIGAAGNMFAKHGIILKRGRGRPKADGTAKKSDIVAPPPDALPGTPPGPAGVDPLRVKLFVAGATGVLKGAVQFCKSWCKKQAFAARIDPEFTAKALAEAEPGPEGYKAWGDALEICAKQYGWDFEHMPAVVLGVETFRIFAPFAGLASEFRAEIKRQRDKDEAASNAARENIEQFSPGGKG
jgi:hypothetical protein